MQKPWSSYLTSKPKVFVCVYEPNFEGKYCRELGAVIIVKSVGFMKWDTHRFLGTPESKINFMLSSDDLRLNFSVLNPLPPRALWDIYVHPSLLRKFLCIK